MASLNRSRSNKNQFLHLEKDGSVASDFRSHSKHFHLKNKNIKNDLNSFVAAAPVVVVTVAAVSWWFNVKSVNCSTDPHQVCLTKCFVYLVNKRRANRKNVPQCQVPVFSGVRHPPKCDPVSFSSFLLITHCFIWLDCSGSSSLFIKNASFYLWKPLPKTHSQIIPLNW